MLKSFLLGVLASFFFAFTFVLNKQMDLAGGSWYWSASLRYFYVFGMLFLYLAIKGRLSFVVQTMKEDIWKWLLWSTVGFGFFYAPLTFASQYGASWAVASTWEITIIAGALLTPLFFETNETDSGFVKVRKKLPKKQLLMSMIILVGVMLVQFEDVHNIDLTNNLIIIATVLFAAFSYPLGNRKIMELNKNKLNTIERVFGMSLMSLPFWIVLSSIGAMQVGYPTSSQVLQTFLVAVFAGVIATLLFFYATDQVSHSVKNLAVIESTQAGAVIFTLVLGSLFFQEPLPSMIGLIGILVVVLGMVLINFTSEKS